MNVIDVGENKSSKRVVVSDFEIEEPNCMNGVTWISGSSCISVGGQLPHKFV